MYMFSHVDVPAKKATLFNNHKEINKAAILGKQLRNHN